MNCFFCKSELLPARTKYIADLGDVVIIVKNVPALICGQCGEKSFDDDTYQRLEEIVNSVRDSLVREVAIVEFTGRAA